MKARIPARASHTSPQMTSSERAEITWAALSCTEDRLSKLCTPERGPQKVLEGLGLGGSELGSTANCLLLEDGRRKGEDDVEGGGN